MCTGEDWSAAELGLWRRVIPRLNSGPVQYWVGDTDVGAGLGLRLTPGSVGDAIFREAEG